MLKFLGALLVALQLLNHKIIVSLLPISFFWYLWFPTTKEQGWWNFAMILIFCSFAMNLIFKNYLLVFAMILIFNPFLGRNKAYVQVEQESYEN